MLPLFCHLSQALKRECAATVPVANVDSRTADTIHFLRVNACEIEACMQLMKQSPASLTAVITERVLSSRLQPLHSTPTTSQILPHMPQEESEDMYEDKGR